MTSFSITLITSSTTAKICHISVKTISIFVTNSKGGCTMVVVQAKKYNSQHLRPSTTNLQRPTFAIWTVYSGLVACVLNQTIKLIHSLNILSWSENFYTLIHISKMFPEAYSEHCQTYKMECFAKLVANKMIYFFVLTHNTVQILRTHGIFVQNY